ncbi:Polycystin cation channel-domain-containing protein [Pelagophyceae sp. CCMP2097]|nr:Polycystin cation channel-domain-containing protein [Pelagophyceae sp. CCMP2097]
MVDPEEQRMLDAQRDDVELFDLEVHEEATVKRKEALGLFLAYWLFLAYIHLAIFSAPYTKHLYQQTNAVKQPLLETEIYPNVFFKDAMSADQMFVFLRGVFLPTVLAETYYSGEPIATTERSFGGGFTAESMATLGRVRLRQIRVGGEGCAVPSFLGRALPAGRRRCYKSYSLDNELSDRWELGDRNLKHTSYSDGFQWQSPFTSVWYGGGGYVVDLPLGLSGSVQEVDALRSLGYVDAQTRVVFVDVSMYNVNVDIFTSARVIFEFQETGKVKGTLVMDSAPLMYDISAFSGSSVVVFNIAMELLLYLMVIGYLFKSADEITNYKTLKDYLAVGWNLMDVASVIFFVASIVSRIIYNFRVYFKSDVGRYQDNVDLSNGFSPDGTYGYDRYIRLRLSFETYRYSRSFFALGILVNFLKAFRYLNVSRDLSQFTQTIYKVSGELRSLAVVMVIILLGFGITTHLCFGHAVEDYKTVGAATWTLLLVIFGSLDIEGVVAVAPTAGLALLVFYVMLTYFVILSMFLKVVDISYSFVQNTTARGDEIDPFAIHLRDAFFGFLRDAYWSVMLRLELLLARGRARSARSGRVVAIDYTGGGTSGLQLMVVEQTLMHRHQRHLVSPATALLERSLLLRARLLKKAGRHYDEPRERGVLLKKMFAESRAVGEGDVCDEDVDVAAKNFEARHGALRDVAQRLNVLDVPRAKAPRAARRRAPRAPPQEPTYDSEKFV